MLDRVRDHWLPWMLCRFFLLVAGLLILLVLACPFLDNGRGNSVRRQNLVTAFARDLAVRRTDIASALGLAATAWIFFRPKTELPITTLARPDSRFPDHREL
jgi:hypothetical protein